MEEILAFALLAGVGALSIVLLVCLDAISSKSTSPGNPRADNGDAMEPEERSTAPGRPA
jgi:hypothetical protein